MHEEEKGEGRSAFCRRKALSQPLNGKEGKEDGHLSRAVRKKKRKGRKNNIQMFSN